MIKIKSNTITAFSKKIHSTKLHSKATSYKELEEATEKGIRALINKAHDDRNLILMYFEKELDKSEYLAFKTRLKTDVDLKEEYDLQVETNTFLEDKDFISFYNKLEAIEADIKKEEDLKK